MTSGMKQKYQNAIHLQVQAVTINAEQFSWLQILNHNKSAYH